MNDAIYTFIINFDAGDKVGWDYAENTPGLGIIGQVFTPKPLTYKEVEELIKIFFLFFDPKEYYSCYGKFIDYKIITITEASNLN
jgi:hypothetical protein